MNFQRPLIKKISFILLIFVLSTNFTFLSVPQKTKAQTEIVGGLINALKPQNVIDTPLNTQTGTKTVWDKAKEAFSTLWSTTWRMMAKKIILNITQATVSWINGGMKGQPAFLGSNLHTFLTGPGGLDDQVMGQFFQDQGLGFLCAPFQLQVKLALQLGYGATLKDKIGCTLTQIEQNASDALTNSSVSVGLDVNGNTVTAGVHDFRNKDGWNDWLSATLQPQNNPVGAYLTAKANLDERLTTTLNGKQIDFLSGGGALSWTTCIDHYYLKGNEIGTSPQYTQGSAQAPAYAENEYDHVNPVCAVKTPGSWITGDLSKLSGSSVDQANLTATLGNSIDAVLGALLGYEMGKLANGVLGDNSKGYDNYNIAINSVYTTAVDNYNSNMSDLYNQQTDLNNMDWTNPYIPVPLPTFPDLFSTSTFAFSTSTWTWDPITGNLFTYSTSTNYDPSLWNYDPTTGLPIVNNATPVTPTTGGGYSALDQAKNNANILMSSLLNSELAYQNNYKIAQNLLTEAEKVFATSSTCNISYNRNDYTLRSLLIRANVTTNIEGISNSDRTIASIPWNLQVIKTALASSNLKINTLNTAATAVSGAGSINAVIDAMIPVNSTSFDTDSQVNMVSNIKTWLRGVGSIYNSLLCPIDLTKVLQINTTTTTS